MEENIYKIYKEVEDIISEEDFLSKMDELYQENKDNPYMNDESFAVQVVQNLSGDKNETISTKTQSIADLQSGTNGITLIARVMGISTPKSFRTKAGKNGKLCNVQLADDTGSIRSVFWTENIKRLKNFNEGDIIEITDLDVKDGYRGGIEVHLIPRSNIKVLNPQDYPNFPAYHEEITPIAEITPDTTVNIIGRIKRVGSIRSFNRAGKSDGKVTSFEIQDASGKINYTLWNNDVKLIESLELNDGDTIKILSAQARERNGEISLSHWDSRIIKGDFDVPEFEEDYIKIADAYNQKDIAVMGLITKIQDVNTFTRSDGTEGRVKSIEIMDDTGSIRVTLWGDNALLGFNKGDILKIVGADVKEDDYSVSGYSLNTNWNTTFSIASEDEENPLIDTLIEYRATLGPIRIEELNDIDEDGKEVDVIGRVISVNDVTKFQRDDGTEGLVRSINFADETGMVRVSFWDSKTDIEFNPGDAYQFENARTKLGMYAVDLNIGRSSRVIKLSEDEARYLPSFETLEEMIYTTRKIVDLDEDDINIRVIGRIIEVNDIREFERENGMGYVKNIEIADNTGSIRVALWDNNAKHDFEVGQAIKIDNPRVTFRDNHLEISTSGNTSIVEPSQKELETLPSFEELKEIIYQVKTIESLEDDDTNVRIYGVFKDAYADKLLLTRCPHCNNPIEAIDDEYICDFCGNEVDEPKYLLMLPGRLEDETGEISITFFGALVEELLDMDLNKILEITEGGSDLGALDGRIDDLDGLNLELIANVNFDEYNEEIRLSPKKILSKTY